MTTNSPDFEPGHAEETEDQPFDGRESQPVEEGSSDDPRTLDSHDPLRDPVLLADELSGDEARPGPEEIQATDDSGLAADLRQADRVGEDPDQLDPATDKPELPSPAAEDEERFDAG